MVTITGLGGFREVGRSAVLLEGEKRFLLDYGLDVQNMNVPIKPKIKLDGMLLSHAHLDHCGTIPELYKRGFMGCVYATNTTLDLAELLLEDSLKVQEKRGIASNFNVHDIVKMNEFSRVVKFGRSVRFGKAEVTFHDAGHVPGSSSILVEMDGRRILYTGDLKLSDTKLMKKAYTDFDDIDVVICESTYSKRDHPNRKGLEKELKKRINEVHANNGITLLPCFAIGRSQEMLQVVSDLEIPIFLDGMGRKATELILNNPGSVRDSKKLREAFGKARKIKKHYERFKLLNKPCAVVTTSGMLNGGPISHYMKKLHKKENCLIYLSGYQVEGTVGNTLQETGRYVNENDNIDVKPKMDIMFRDWSAHAGRTTTIEFIKKINPGKVIFNHGDSCEEFADDLKGMGFDAIAPGNGEKIEV